MTGAQFLNSPLSVREAGMGQVSMGSSDILRAWSNPALLADQDTRGTVGMSGGSLFGGDLTGIGVGAGWLASPSWAVGAAGMSFNSSFAEVNGDGDETGTSVNQGVMAAGLGAAWRGSWLKAGVLAKVVSDDLAGDRATAVAGDAGVVGRWGEASVGIAGRNLGSALREAQSGMEAQSLPSELRFAVSYRLRAWHVLMGAEYASELSAGGRLGCGVEWWPVRLFAVRTGAQRNRAGQVQMTAGLSAGYQRLSIDYAAVTHTLGLNHRMSVSYGFGKTAEELAASWPKPEQGRSPVQAEPASSRRTIAVADLVPQGVSAADAAMVSEMLRSDLIRTGAFSVVEKQNMDKILAEQMVQQYGCTTESCAVRLGRLLNVRLMLVGSFGRLLGSYLVNVRVIDVETAESVYGKTSPAVNLDEVQEAVESVVAEIARTCR